MKFLHGQCPLPTSCPLAHPGVRDSAEIGYTRIPGRTKKVPYVKVCRHWISSHEEEKKGAGEEGSSQHGSISTLYCKEDKDCKHYHVYIRPSTADIIRRLYPMEVRRVITRTIYLFYFYDLSYLFDVHPIYCRRVL